MERTHTTGGFNTRLDFPLSLPFPPCGLSLLQHVQHLDVIAEEPLLGRLFRVLRGQELPTDHGKAHDPTYSMGIHPSRCRAGVRATPITVDMRRDGRMINPCVGNRCRRTVGSWHAW
jgi:hypothetical protein